MNIVKRTWRAGCLGKLTVGCGGLIIILFGCIAVSVMSTPPRTPPRVSPAQPVTDNTNMSTTSTPAIVVEVLGMTTTPEPTPAPTASPEPRGVLAQMAQGACKEAFVSAVIEADRAIVVCHDNDLLFNAAETFFELARDTFPALPINMLDCRFTATFVDKYGKESQHTWLRAVITRATHDKIEWKNMGYIGLIELLMGLEKGNGNIVAVRPGAQASFELETGVELDIADMADMWPLLREIETPEPEPSPQEE